MRPILLLYILSFSLPGNAQKQFSKEELLNVVKQFHPIAKQAMIDVKIAEAGITSARGLFDPVISTVTEQKEWQGITYYDQQQTNLSIPVWYGININTGSETIRGDKINPEETKGSINYVSVSVPLIQNFIIDKRKAIIQQSKLLREETDANRRKIINDLLYEAIAAYWEWWEQHKTLEIIKGSVKNAEQRLQMVRNAYLLGERPAVDTIESLAQLETLRQNEAEAMMELLRKRLTVSLYLWTKDETPYELPEDVAPAEPRNEMIVLDSVLSSAGLHPEMQAYEYKLRSLSIERKLKLQALVPAVNFKYNHSGTEIAQTITGAWNNNYRLGLSVAIPLRFSEARGDYRAAKLKLNQVKLAQDNKLLQLQNKVKQYYTEWQQAIQQLAIQKTLVNHFTALQKAEETRFFNGESSMFLVNVREIKKLEAIQKRIAFEAKQQKSSAAILWAAALLHR